jgi:hypothetical protein
VISVAQAAVCFNAAERSLVILTHAAWGPEFVLHVTA